MALSPEQLHEFKEAHKRFEAADAALSRTAMNFATPRAGNEIVREYLRARWEFEAVCAAAENELGTRGIREEAPKPWQ